jgi:hypothetical protein
LKAAAVAALGAAKRASYRKRAVHREKCKKEVNDKIVLSPSSSQPPSALAGGAIGSLTNTFFIADLDYFPYKTCQYFSSGGLHMQFTKLEEMLQLFMGSNGSIPPSLIFSALSRAFTHIPIKSQSPYTNKSGFNFFLRVPTSNKNYTWVARNLPISKYDKQQELGLN